MSTSLSIFVIVVTVTTLACLTWFLQSNRGKSNGQPIGHEFDGIEELDTPLPGWWVAMFFASIVFAIGYLIWYPGLGAFSGLSGWTSAGQLEARAEAHAARFAPLYERLAALDVDAARHDRQAMSVGRRLFLNNCSSCHGVAGSGGFGFPNLADDEWLWGGDIASIRTTITSGREGIMPPWGAAFDDRTITGLAQHVRHLAGLGDPAPEAAVQQFRTICASCHGREGKPVLPGVPDLSNDAWLYGSDLATIEFTIRNGRHGVMPAHAGILSPAEIAIVANYVASLAETSP